MNTQVLIVGGGPTGLMAANQLLRFGIDFILIDSKSGPTIESRAIAAIKPVGPPPTIKTWVFIQKSFI